MFSALFLAILFSVTGYFLITHLTSQNQETEAVDYKLSGVIFPGSYQTSLNGNFYSSVTMSVNCGYGGNSTFYSMGSKSISNGSLIIDNELGLVAITGSNSSGLIDYKNYIVEINITSKNANVEIYKVIIDAGSGTYKHLWESSTSPGLISTGKLRFNRDDNGLTGTTFAPFIYVYCTFTYYINGTTKITVNGYENTSTASPSSYAKTGYTLEGFYSGTNKSGLQVLDEYGKHSNSYRPGGTIYPGYTANTYTVKYNANGGSGSLADQSFTYDASQNLRTNNNNITRTGYTFLGWSTSSTATSATYTNGQSVKNLTSTNNGTVNLYAVWQKNSYYVDVNNYLDGTNDGAIGKGFSFSVKYNDTVKTGLTDFYEQVPYGSKVELYNISIGEGRTYSSYSISVNGVEQSGSTKNKIIITVPSQRVNITLNFTTNSYNLSVDPNGGTWNNSLEPTTFTQTYGTTKALLPPGDRTGFTFEGWMLGGKGTISSFGKLHDSYADPFFKTGTNGTVVYNNLSNGNVTHTYLDAKYADIPLPSGARILRITNTGTASPNLGGFTNHLPTATNKVYYAVIYAKIPIGYSIASFNNSYGNNASKTWLTSQEGTGDWEVYIHRWNCGSSGTFSSVNYYAISGPVGSAENPVVWDVAYFGTYDATNLTVNEGNTQTLVYTFGASNSSLVALWSRNSVTINLNVDGGEISTQQINAKYKDFINLPNPTKEGYVFAGWQIISGNANIVSTQLLGEEKTFDGVDDFIAIGRDDMHSNKITISISAYMDNWAEYATKNMRIISCTETGGWNLENNNGNIQVPVYDKGVGYKTITLDKQWSSLKSGWHNFTIAFNGSYVKFYIDDQFETKSSDFSSGAIGYNNTNGIFIGGEAGANQTTPVARSYFKGKIKDVIIINDDIYGKPYNINSATNLIPTANTTIKAQWKELWLNHTDAFEGKGTQQEPYQISSAENLAYLSKQVYEGTNYSGKYFVQTTNIDLSAYYWQPIGIEYNREGRLVQSYFAGNYDGKLFTISGIKTVGGVGPIYSG